MQVPQTGYVSFTLVPSGTPIGQGGIIPANNLGLASVTIVKQPGNQGVSGIPPPGAYTGDALSATNSCFCSQGSLHAVPAMPSACNELPVCRERSSAVVISVVARVPVRRKPTVHLSTDQ